MRRAHAKAEVFSGNSEMNGATHWMKTNCEMPRLDRHGEHRVEERLGDDEDDERRRRRRGRSTAAHRFQPEKDRAQRDTARDLLVFLFESPPAGGILRRTKR